MKLSRKKDFVQLPGISQEGPSIGQAFFKESLSRTDHSFKGDIHTQDPCLGEVPCQGTEGLSLMTTDFQEQGAVLL